VASGVAASVGLIKVLNDGKVYKPSMPGEVNSHRKALLFCQSENKKNTGLEEDKEMLVDDVGLNVGDPYAIFIKMLPDTGCHYALYDVAYETKKNKEDVLFIFWAPESALKNKIIYASSKKDQKKKKNCYKEVKDRCTLAENLGRCCCPPEGKPF
uniref:ADF-H domain-containing protein n=1 Tax=Otolemur garnettii TaxID=30611 RepID=H0XPM8_OTOGA